MLEPRLGPFGASVERRTLLLWTCSPGGRFEHVEARFDVLQLTMLQVGGGVIVALLGLIATQL